MPEQRETSVNSDLEIKLFKGLVDDFTASYVLDFAGPQTVESQTEINRMVSERISEVNKLAYQCVSEGLPAGLISLARKTAAIQACASIAGVYYE